MPKNLTGQATEESVKTQVYLKLPNSIELGNFNEVTYRRNLGPYVSERNAYRLITSDHEIFSNLNSFNAFGEVQEADAKKFWDKLNPDTSDDKSSCLVGNNCTSQNEFVYKLSLYDIVKKGHNQVYSRKLLEACIAQKENPDQEIDVEFREQCDIINAEEP